MKWILTPLVILAVFIVGTSSQVNTVSDLPVDFKSDGCSMFPEGNYHECCVAHDKAYFVGGSLKERRAADVELYRCVRSRGNGKFLASMIWLGVRIGGVSFLPTPFRWGFGNKFPRKAPDKPPAKKLTGR
jgi:hypothetical protein